MRGKIIGIQPVQYLKKDGTEANGFTVYFTSKHSSTFGEKCGDTYVSWDKPMAQQFIPYKNKVLELLGKEVDIDRNSRGFVDSIELVV